MSDRVFHATIILDIGNLGSLFVEALTRYFVKIFVSTDKAVVQSNNTYRSVLTQVVKLLNTDSDSVDYELEKTFNDLDYIVFSKELVDRYEIVQPETRGAFDQYELYSLCRHWANELHRKLVHQTERHKEILPSYEISMLCNDCVVIRVYTT